MGIPSGILLSKIGYKKTSLVAVAAGCVGVLIQTLSGFVNLETMGGITEKIAVRLVDLYMQATASNNVIQEDEDLEKNSRVTVEM